MTKIGKSTAYELLGVLLLMASHRLAAAISVAMAMAAQP